MYHYAIIGSGVAGATIAKELNDNVVILEKGDVAKYISEGDHVEVSYVCGLGGSGVFSLGNAMKVKLKGYKINKEIYKEIWEELKINVPNDDFLSKIDRELLSMGFKKMEKFIDFKKCNRCGKCAKKFCKAKWNPLNYLKGSKADIIKNFEIREIIREKDYFIINSKNRKIKAKNIIISAGGINSPRILRKLTKDDFGNGFFVDTFITVGGVLENSYLNENIPMLVYRDYKDFIISPHYTNLLYEEIKKENDVKEKDIMGLMIKIRDSLEGEILENDIKKEIAVNDIKLLAKGVSKATKFLNKLGIDEIYSTRARGSHPGGSLREIKDFEVMDNVYVCDASILKEPLGKPPIISIIALSKIFVRNYLMG
ncbi:glucose-methanol-choline oxidoreductase [Methanocaldococcus villosus KIN24-T80]|uniref:Glucose-methanol-choline oxidoreductase n=1 Tax=Methanocaldococcus villosus KIN24-T80 TaxID=1069083 RepID=N6VP80_9EURY|nr:hypothetical protein [Methanocaldococcus villosus]ENN95675.1 glucose-methanol-choline oxidoreductase [Methanocaldococcus villosus KIN24-T80]